MVESRVALLTTTAHFAEGDDPEPFGIEGLAQEQTVVMTGEFGKTDAVLSEIPITTSRVNTRVRHGGYDNTPPQQIETVPCQSTAWSNLPTRES